MISYYEKMVECFTSTVYMLNAQLEDKKITPDSYRASMDIVTKGFAEVLKQL